MKGYNILIPDICKQNAPGIVLPMMDSMQRLGHTPVILNMVSIHNMYHQMRYQSRGCYEIFQFYVEDIVKKGHIDFGFSVGMGIVMEDRAKQEAHHLLEECAVPNVIYMHVSNHDVVEKLDTIGIKEWKHTFLAVSSHKLVRMLKGLGLERVAQVYPGTSFRIFYPADNPSDQAAYRILDDDERLAKDAYDVSFAGSYTIGREEYLKALVDSGVSIAIFGDQGWKSSEINKYYRGHAKYLAELNTIYNASKINIDLPHDRAILDDYISSRVFDCLAAGGCLATRRSSSIEEIVELEREVIAYDDVSSFVKAIQYYLSNEGDRLGIARRGHQRILKEANWDNRLNKLIPQLEMHLLTVPA